MNWDVIILGAGAAGLMCAMEAGKRGRKILVLEKNERVGKKILISGGGRCNFTNLYSRPENFLSSNDSFFKSALSRFSPQDFISLLERHGIEYYEKKAGQLFCKSSAKEITQLLLRECEEARVTIRTSCEIRQIRRSPKFILETNQGAFESPALFVATGGLSFANLGASDLGYRIAQQFGLNVIDPFPGLVPLIFNPADQKRFSHLTGISLEARVLSGKRSFREDLLFTHRGLSGPAILQISSYWKPGDALHVDLLPDFEAREWLFAKKSKGGKIELKNLLSQKLPKRFAETWCELHFPSRPVNEISDKNLEKIAQSLHDWVFTPETTEGYDKAEVTCGGVDTDELSSKTMEAKKVPGLFFIGEVVDVTGHLGGHNFQWAWASGFAAGQVV